MTKKACLLVALLVSISYALPAQVMTDEELLKAIEENPYRAAGGHNAYEAPAFSDTPAPAGYEAFYVSHYGRHGSRYQGGTEAFRKVLPKLDSLSACKLLTPAGDSLRMELHLMEDAHSGMEGILTQKGSAEHREIAERLCRRVPSAFSCPSRPCVECVSTSVQRCIQSMANFTTAVKGAFPGVSVTYRTGMKYLDTLSPKSTRKKAALAAIAPVLDSLLKAASVFDSIAGRLFKNPENVDREFIYGVFEAAQGASCLDIDVNPFRFFTPSELFELWKVRNVYFCAFYGTLDFVKEYRWNAAALARLVLSDADAAIEGNGRCADFRFGHDGGVGPLAGLLAIEGYDRPAPRDSSHNYWQSWKYIPMGTNIQLIFYRRGASDILVKILFNEREVGIPALAAASGPYYRWSDLRKYVLKRIG